MKEKPLSAIEPLVDLTGITDAARQLTVVSVQYGGEGWHDWLRFGECRLAYHEGLDEWTLGAYLAGETTDVEHDAAYAVRLPLIGLLFKFAIGGQMTFSARIGGDSDDFCIPKPGYNPLAKAAPCRSCKGANKHLIVPEGCYVPKPDPELYARLLGKRVNITLEYRGAGK